MDLKTAKDSEISPEVQKDRTFLVCLLLFPTVLLFVLLSSLYCDGGLARAREGTASSMISQLAQAAKAYELDHAAYPPGHGTGSKVLAEFLQRKGAKQMQYFEFTPDMIDQGNVVNPVWGKEGTPPKNWIHYRCPGLHNPQTFDLWCTDSKGKVDGINNW